MEEFDLEINESSLDYNFGSTLVVRTLDWLSIEKELQYFDFKIKTPDLAAGLFRRV